jgi:hypothetical protein
VDVVKLRKFIRLCVEIRPDWDGRWTFREKRRGARDIVCVLGNASSCKQSVPGVCDVGCAIGCSCNRGTTLDITHVKCDEPGQ